MLHYALIFFIVAIVAAVLGFSGTVPDRCCGRRRARAG